MQLTTCLLAENENVKKNVFLINLLTTIDLTMQHYYKGVQEVVSPHLKYHTVINTLSIRWYLIFRLFIVYT